MASPCIAGSQAALGLYRPTNSCEYVVLSLALLIINCFRVTRTPEDAPNTPEDAPVVFYSTFRELPGATGIASIGAQM